jgi:hypothetical protein
VSFCVMRAVGLRRLLTTDPVEADSFAQKVIVWERELDPNKKSFGSADEQKEC